METSEAKKILEDAHKNFLNKNYRDARILWLKCLEINPDNISLLSNH